MDMNQTNLVGHMACDPQLNTEGESPRVFFILAVNRDGQDEADFIPITVWGKLATAVATHCRKGKELAIQAQLRTSRTQNSDGSYTHHLQVVARRISFGADSKKTQTQAPAEPAPQPQAPQPQAAQAQLLALIQQLVQGASTPQGGAASGGEEAPF